MLGAGRWVYVVLYSYVPRGGSRFTYCKLTNSRRKIFAVVVPTLSIQFISSHINDFLFGGNKSPRQDQFLVLSSRNVHLAGGLAGVSILFEIVRLGRP